MFSDIDIFFLLFAQDVKKVFREILKKSIYKFLGKNRRNT